MTFDIQKHVSNAQAQLREALDHLANARHAYEDGTGPKFAAAKAGQDVLNRKIQAAESDADAASQLFHKAFSDAGFEADEATRAALNRKNDAQAMAEVMRAAHAKGVKQLQELAIDASQRARTYAKAYENAYAAHVQAEGYKAIEAAGAQIAYAMALAAHAPRSSSVHEDSLGRPAPTKDMRNVAVADRWAFILQGLKDLAEGQPEFATRPRVEALGVFDLGALTAQDVLTPAQVHLIRHAARAAS